MSNNKRRHKSKGRVDHAHEKALGLQEAVRIKHVAEAQAMVFERAFERMYEDYGTTRPRLSKEQYIEDAITELANEKKIVIQDKGGDSGQRDQGVG